MNRRLFLQRALAAGAMAWLAPAAGVPLLTGARRRGIVPPTGRKLVIVQFGGGARYSETVGDPQHRYIPCLWNDLAPRGVLFTNLRVEGKVVHPNSTGSMLTGHWEWDDLDWTQPVRRPTVFEIYRQATRTPDLKTWAFVYASILAKAGESSADGFGPRFAANVAVPPTIPRSTAEVMDCLMHQAAATGAESAATEAVQTCAALARSTSRISLDGLRSNEARAFIMRQYSAWKARTNSTSHDAFLAECAIACMKAFSPDIVAVCFGEIDCAHYGSWSRYVEAIRRTDALTGRLWETVQGLEEYRNRTLMLILPDHGRELESSGGLGFVHHSDFYTGQGADEGCRRVWMLGIGPGLPANQTVEKPLPITAVAATGLEFMGLRASPGAATSVWGL